MMITIHYTFVGIISFLQKNPCFLWTPEVGIKIVVTTKTETNLNNHFLS